MDDIITEESALGGATGGLSDVIDDGRMFVDSEPTIWICLQCGYQVCHAGYFISIIDVHL